MRKAGTATAVAAVVIVLAGVGGGCGGDDEAAKEQLRQQQLDEARTEGERDERLREYKRRLREKKKSPGAPSAPPEASGSARTSCGDGLSVGPNTSCPFGREVRGSYPGSSATFEVYSPTTGMVYTMSCTTGSPHECKGGNNASVYFP